MEIPGNLGNVWQEWVELGFEWGFLLLQLGKSGFKFIIPDSRCIFT